MTCTVHTRSNQVYAACLSRKTVFFHQIDNADAIRYTIPQSSYKDDRVDHIFL